LQVLLAAGRVHYLIWTGEWWRLVTAPLVHATVWRLAWCCLGLLVFGSFLESRIGSLRTAFVFGFSCMAGAVADLGLSPSVSGGASPGVLGVLVASMAVLLRHPRDEDDVTRAGLGLAAAVAILLTVGVGTLGQGPDNLANGGGFVGGLLTGALLGTRRHPEPTSRRLALGALVVLLGWLAAVALRPDAQALARWHSYRGAEALKAGDYMSAREELNLASTWDPWLPSAHWNLAILHQRLGPDRVFRRELAEALRLEPANADMQENLAMWLFGQGRAADAEATLRIVLRLVPQRGRAWRMLGGSQRLQGRDDEAAASFRRALELEPGDPDALTSLAELYESRGRPEDARPFWTSLAGRKPSGEREPRQVARACLALGRARGGVDILDAALRDAPDAVDLLGLRAEANACLGRFPAALADALAYARRAPGKWLPAYLRARVLQWWASSDAADRPAPARIAAAYRDALASAGSPREARLTRGFLALFSGDAGPRFAERNARAVLAESRWDEEARFLLGLALERQGRLPEARDALREACRLDAASPEYAAALNRAAEALRRASPAPAPPRRG